MKKHILFIAVSVFCFLTRLNAQVSVSVNLGLQPLWGPTGYDYVQYYYIPDIDAYYDVYRHEYVYYEGGGWVYHRVLPPRYRTYDLYHGYKVVVNEPTPWVHHDRYVREYAQYRGRHDQPFIRDAHDVKYYANPRHPHHAEWVTHNGPGHNAPRQAYQHNEVREWHGNRPAMPPGQVRKNEMYHPGSPGHGHEERGHEQHGHEEHGHEDHGHGEHGHGHR